mgnify:CR=1 FL=1
MDNETSQFLGRDYQWRDAEIRLEDVQALYGGVRLWIAKWGKPSVRRVARGGEETRYKIPFARDEKSELLQLFVRQDFLTIKPPERAGVPDEARPVITLTNAKRETHTVTKWAGVQDARFDLLYDALLAIADRSKDVRPEPERLRPFQKTLFIIGLILLILSPFVIGNLVARLVVDLWWPEQIGRLMGSIPILGLGIVALLLSLYWRERDKRMREQTFTNPILWGVCGIFLFFVLIGWMGLIQKGVFFRWAETAVGTVQSLDHNVVYNDEYGWDDYYNVGFIFQTEAGDEIRRTASVSRGYFESLAVDTAVTVYYLPFFPRIAALEQSVQSPNSAIFAYTFLIATYLIILEWGLFAQRVGQTIDERF